MTHEDRMPNPLTGQTERTENVDRFVKDLVRQEEAEITEVIAVMSYIPSIGRVLQKGSVQKFRRLATRLVADLRKGHGRANFDRLHETYTRRVIGNFATARGQTLSYGQAQKPINVFLKVYVDWSGRPTPAIRRQLLPHLHVPLDSVLMEVVRKEYPSWHRAAIRPHIRVASDVDSLRAVTKWQYNKWQAFFRQRYPPKPLIFDVVWALNR